MQGKLYLCATPIGNLEDITFRVVRTLKEVDLIAAEDTRNSIKLLNHFEIKTPMTSYHEYNKIDKARTLIAEMQSGKNVALITDAGTPGISDQGEELVKMCYEAPHHLVKTLKELLEVLGDRKCTICRELTKRYETAFQTTLSGAISYYQENEPKGEFVLVIQGKLQEELIQEEREAWEELSLEEHMAHYEKQGISRKEAMKLVAKDRGISKREVYAALLSE